MLLKNKFYIITCSLILICNILNAQEKVFGFTKGSDSLYKEDQLYMAITYNLLSQKPDGISQTGFSHGLHLGYISDMPINKRRNLAFGVGLGYSFNLYNQNLLILKQSDDTYSYSKIEDEQSYSKNKIFTHLVEVPIQFRWRTSTKESFKFWRIYSGVKIGYMFAKVAHYKGNLGNIRYTDLDDFNTFQYGLTLSVGYNTWNFYSYYGLNEFLKKSATFNNQQINMRTFNLGLIFYLL